MNRTIMLSVFACALVGLCWHAVAQQAEQEPPVLEADADQDDDQSADDEQESFVPSETINVDTEISFPVDI